ncbi:MAG: type II secretion system F family protein [Candidatus ainarchaeum sp.]|nr:type II secretion system F family protein [Candidatus ainarchaeum sp.]
MNEKESIILKYNEWVKFSNLPYNAGVWIGITILITSIIAFVTTIISVIILQEITLMPVALSIAALVLLAGYPYMRKESIIDTIEYNFSDALKQMADTLKAGDTYESALREVVNSDYGRLSEEMKLALRRLEEGENIETSLRGFAERIDSRLVKRTIIILLDSIKTGASLANILEDIADDVRDAYRLKEERKANTTMQFMFMIAASGFITPLIFGEVTSIMNLFSRITLNEIGMITGNNITNFILILIQAYLIIEVIASGIMMAIIRDGKFGKSIIYIPLLLILAFVTYYASSYVIGLMLLGAF